MSRAGGRQQLAVWVEALASPNSKTSEAAKEALATAGPRALPVLLEALESDDERLRLRSISLLSLLGDSETAAPLAALLHDPAPRIRARAALALTRAATPSTVAALARLLKREAELPVRHAVVRALVRLVQSSHDEALRPLLNLLSDHDEPAKLRLAALDVLPWIACADESRGPRSLLVRLSHDPERAVAERARKLIASPPRLRFEPWAVQRWIDRLDAERMTDWRDAVSRLSQLGGGAIDPLIEALRSRSGEATFAQRAALVLKGTSPRQLAKLAPLFDEPQDPVTLTPLVELVAASGSRTMLARVASMLRRLQHSDEAASPSWVALRARGHLALARAGSRLGIEDLAAMLDERGVPVSAELAEAAGLIATERELPALIRAYLRTRGEARLAVREAVRALFRREKLRLCDRILGRLKGSEQRAVSEVVGGSKRNGHHDPMPRPRVDRPTGALLI